MVPRHGWLVWNVVLGPAGFSGVHATERISSKNIGNEDFMSLCFLTIHKYSHFRLKGI